jgi:hypothetical protein
MAALPLAYHDVVELAKVHAGLVRRVESRCIPHLSQMGLYTAAAATTAIYRL